MPNDNQDELFDLSSPNPADKKGQDSDKYDFEPIKGYPMLNWRGKRPFTSTQYYPAQLKEVHGSDVDGWRNRIYWGDNLQVMSHLLKEFRGKVDLVYIDPPFDSKAEYKKIIQKKGIRVENDSTVFEEKQYTDIWTNDEYLQYIYKRLALIRELLSNTGSIYLHCDWHKCHYLRSILDEIFGQNNFINQIAWKRSNPHGNQLTRYGSIHDVILFYSKSDRYIWNPQFDSHSNEYIKDFYKHIEHKTNRRYRLGPLNNFAGVDRPNLTYDWNGFYRTWRYTKDKMQKLHNEDRLVYSSTGLANQKIYLDEMKGVPPQDLWLNIKLDKTEYPTQKPEALLDKIIQTSSNPGDLVLDCFMGSGTTQAVAMKLGRRFIGADINLGAIQTTTKRLLKVAAELDEKQAKLDLQTAKTANNDEIENNQPTEPTVLYTGFEVYNVNHYDVFRNPVEARDILIEALELNRFEASHLFDGEKDGRLWKIMPINRIATRADLNELISGLDYKSFEKRQQQHPTQPVERITLVCMGHEPDLAARLKTEVHPFTIDVDIVDIYRDKKELQFKRDSEAEILIRDGQLIIERFYPMNLLQKLSLETEKVEDWRELVESIMIDWNYDGAVLEPVLVDVPDKQSLVQGVYPVPEGAGTIRVKITDLLSESLEMEIKHG